MNASKEELLALLERVEKTTGPDRELDCLIGCIDDLRPHPDEQSWADRMARFGLEHCLKSATSHQNVWRELLPSYTASVDCALALVERVLPGRAGDMLTKAWMGTSSTIARLPLAIIAALLRALISQSEEKGE